MFFSSLGRQLQTAKRLASISFINHSLNAAKTSQLRFFSDEKKEESDKIQALNHPKTKQSAINVASKLTHGYIPEIKPDPCQETIIISTMQKFLESNKPIQIHQGCLLEVMRIIDLFNKRTSLFNDPEIIAVISGKVSIERSNLKDFRVRTFIKAHLQHDGKLTDQQRHLSPTDHEFITKIVGHNVLSDIYISARKLELHFKKTGQPVYTMVSWGRDGEIETGYHVHAILVFGIDSSNMVHFWDVNDKLPTGIPRMRTMSIEDFNDRRNLSPAHSSGIIRAGFARSTIYYLNKEKEI